MSNIWVVLPTYNERENLERIVGSLLALIQELKILIVDDNSPDGTGKIADRLADRERNRVFALHHPCKIGLGPAYIDGFQEVLQKGAERIIQMDADFSHPVRFLPSLLESSRETDLVIGSRYVSGGGIQGWSYPRRILSRLGNLYARYLLRSPIRDMTSGFKCWRRDALTSLPFSQISLKGYGFQIATVTLAMKKGFSVKEIPILFQERDAGKSKMSWSIALEAMIEVWKMRLQDL